MREDVILWMWVVSQAEYDKRVSQLSPVHSLTGGGREGLVGRASVKPTLFFCKQSSAGRVGWVVAGRAAKNE